jgi:ComF family protein
MSGRQFRALISQVFNHLLNPRLCIGCGHALQPLQYFCPTCASLLNCIESACQLCGLENQTNHPICPTCLYHPPRWQKIIAPLIYHNFSRDLLIQLKFNENLYLANSLVSHLIKRFQHRNGYPEVLIPVPLHQSRLIDRGYNQAFEIANILSKKLDIPIDTQALTRIRHTESQLGLSAHQRAKNTLKAFKYEPVIQYAHVAVVDDVITTGSTANEVTKTLHRAGVTIVEIWGLARVFRSVI